jgi:hypothetical protein
LRLHPVTERTAARNSVRRPADVMPRWVKIFCVVALIVIVLIVGLHLAGGGTGHLAHGDTDTAPGGHDRHRP